MPATSGHICLVESKTPTRALAPLRDVFEERSGTLGPVGLIWHDSVIRIERSYQGAAASLQNFPGSIEGEVDAHRLGVAVQIVEHDAVGRRHNFLQPERPGREGIESGLPIGLQRRAAAVDRAFIAFAGEACVQCVQIEQRFEIALAASIEPVDGDGYLIKVFRHVRHIHLVYPARVEFGNEVRRSR